MTSRTRQPTWEERENNKNRERRRRAITANIFSGLRMYGNYQLPRHCENNEVLKALCNEAGWIVEPDGTTYRKGCKPIKHMDMVNGSTATSLRSSHHPSPRASYNPRPGSSSFLSPCSSSYATALNGDGNSLIPWLKNLPYGSASASSSKLPQLYVQASSTNAPISPPLSSPSTQFKAEWDEQCTHLGWGGPQYSLFPSSTTPSPSNQIVDLDCFTKIRNSQGAPTSPPFNLISSNPLGFKEDVMVGSSSHMWKPRQSGTCSPIIARGSDHTAYIPTAGAISNEFTFGSSATNLVKLGKGEMINEDFGADDLELTLGTSKIR